MGKSKIFHMQRAAMTWRLIGAFAMPAIGVLCMLLVIALVLGLVLDIRFLIVALMIVMIVAPMVLALLYFNYAMRPECFINIAPHTLEFLDQGVRVEVFEEISETNPDDNPANNPDTKSVVKSKEPRYESRYVRLLPYSDMHRFIVESAAIRVPLGRPRPVGFLWVPAEAYADPAAFRAAVDTLSRNLRERGAVLLKG